MSLGKIRTGWLLPFLGLVIGCAPQAVILHPGALSLVVQPPGAKTGSLWVATARDARPADQSGQKVGVFFTRFQKEPLPVYVEPKPEIYVRDQLDRYLFNRGYRAAGAGSAQGFVTVDVEEFSVAETPGSVWDEFKIRVAYTVRISDRSGQELGKVRLEGAQQIQTPLDAKENVEKALRDALADTFDTLSRSEAFRTALNSLAN